MRIGLIFIAISIFTNACDAAAPDQKVERVYTLESCEAWYAARHYDWAHPRGVSSPEFDLDRMCPIFHKALLAGLYEDGNLTPYQVEIDPLESCNKQANEIEPGSSNKRFQTLVRDCMRRHHEERYLDSECTRDGVSFSDKGAYLWCRIFIASESREPWESNYEIRQKQRRTYTARGLYQMDVMHWFEDVSRFGPKLSCPNGDYESDLEQCTVSFASPPYPVQISGYEASE